MAIQVVTQAGRVEGREAHGISVFQGIPYARPPVGSLRFVPPQPVMPWVGVRDASRPGPSAPQNAPSTPFLGQLLGLGAAGHDEDCLYLNVWTPAADRRRRPVLVWIHGGGFVVGSGATALYSGGRMAKAGDVVVVTINYRLGALGNLNLGALDSRFAGNFGLRDQIAALEWVRDNIEQFGGDPENVTIFGESAGGMSVGSLLGTDAAGRLFHRAIAQSGAASNVSTRAHSATIATQFLRQLNMASLDIEKIRRRPVADLLAAQRWTSIRARMELGLLPWQPSIDDDILREQPLDRIASGALRNVDLVVGTNRDEWQLFLLADAEGRRLTEEGWEKRLSRFLFHAAGDDGSLRAAAADTYGPRARGWSPTESWVAFQSDWIFHRPADRLAAAHAAAGGRVHLYLFDWQLPLVGGWTGSFHGLEIPFVFGTLRDGILRRIVVLDRSALALSETVQAAWVAFARSGMPQHEGLPVWHSYDDTHRRTMVLGRSSATEEGFFEDRREFWHRIAA